jgi:mannose-6-phosphate isomerase-like protein (cupin superfamily)
MSQTDQPDQSNQAGQPGQPGSPKPPQFDTSQFSTEPFVKHVEKPWGYELHFAQESLPYMSKLMHINAGARQSLQLHDSKQETYVLIRGRGGLEWQDASGQLIRTELHPFVGYHTSVGQKHRLYAMEDSDCDIMETSTQEAGTTWRLEDDYQRPNETPLQRRRERQEQPKPGELSEGEIPE